MNIIDAIFIPIILVLLALLVLEVCYYNNYKKEQKQIQSHTKPNYHSRKYKR